MLELSDPIINIQLLPAALPSENDASAARFRLSEALIRTAKQDREAFRELYHLTSAKLFGICLRICGERQGAQDVLQNVYLTIWKRAGAFEPGRASPMSWLATIARNRSIDWLRAKKARNTVSLEHAFDVADTGANAEAIVLMADAFRRLHICLDALSETQGSAIYAAFFRGLTYSQLAKERGVPIGTMKSLIRRTLAQLRTRLDDTDDHRQ